MPLSQDQYYPARWVHVSGHIPDPSSMRVYAVGCGRSVRDISEEDETYFTARYIDIDDQTGDKFYAVASDGCQPPLDLSRGLARLDTTCVSREAVWDAINTEPYFVEPENFPPWGLSRFLRAELRAPVACADLDCVGAYLTYVASGVAVLPSGCAMAPQNGVWTGCFESAGGGRLPVWVYYDEDAPVGLRFQACVGGDETEDCRPGVEAVLAGGSDPWTFSFVSPINAFGGGKQCCECSGGQLSLDIRSFCRPYRPGRLIAIAENTRTYAVADCVLPTCTPNADCCVTLAHCNFTATVTVEGDCCADLAGAYTLFYNGTVWSTFGGGLIEACSRHWTLFMGCVDGVLTFNVINTDVGATCSGTSDPQDCPDPAFPLDVTFEVEVGCTFGNPDFPDKCTPVLLTIRVTS